MAGTTPDDIEADDAGVDAPASPTELPSEVREALQGLIVDIHEGPLDSSAVLAAMSDAPAASPAPPTSTFASLTGTTASEFGLDNPAPADGLVPPAQGAPSQHVVAQGGLPDKWLASDNDPSAESLDVTGWLRLNWPYVVAALFILLGIILITIVVTTA